MDDAHFKRDLADTLNRHCAESASDTPDFVLAEYMLDCLRAFDKALAARIDWYAEPKLEPGDDHDEEPPFGDD